MSAGAEMNAGGAMNDAFTLLTGGSSGIGAVTCGQLLAAGHRVISLDRKPGELASPNLRHVEVDLSDARATAASLGWPIDPPRCFRSSAPMRPT